MSARKYFGTDGIRGKVGDGDVELAQDRLGRLVGGADADRLAPDQAR